MHGDPFLSAPRADATEETEELPLRLTNEAGVESGMGRVKNLTVWHSSRTIETMRAVLLDGAREQDKTLELIYAALTQEFRLRDLELVAFQLRNLEIAPCQGCFGCWIKTPGRCLVDDPSQEIAKELPGSELLVFLTPVTFGGYSSELKKALDRQICFISPFFSKIEGETHHRRRYESSPRLIAIGLYSRPDSECEQIFRTLVGRNAINLHSPAHAVGFLSYGAPEPTIRDGLIDLLNEVGL